MPKDVTPPTTHVSDWDNGPRSPEYSPLQAEAFRPEYPDKKAVENVANLVASGNIQDMSQVANRALDAYRNHLTHELQDAVNKKLADMKSFYRIKVDDSMAGVQDIGGLSVDLIDTNSRKVVDSCGVTIDNSPKVPYPPIEFPKPEQKPELPSDWPRLDIYEPPAGKHKSPWS